MLYRISFVVITLACSIVAMTGSAQAQTQWQLDPFITGSWHNPLHWSAGIPAATSAAAIENGGWAEISANAEWLSLALNGAGESGVHQLTGISQGQTLRLGEDSTDRGQYIIEAEAELGLDSLVLGRWGRGRFTHNDGDVGVNWVDLGVEATGEGTYELIDGHLSLFESIRVGVNGVGTLQIGNATHEPSITGPAVAMTVRAGASGSGKVFGWGLVNVTGDLTNNGCIIADGFGQDRTLDLRRFSSIHQQESFGLIQGDGTQAGWYARNGGALLLPTVTVAEGTGAYNWGEQAGDSTPDLVNSVRLEVQNAASAGDFAISLLADDRTDLPPMPEGYVRIGAWQIDFDPALSFSAADFLVRYDDQAAAQAGILEQDLFVWRYDGQRWRTKATTVDELNHRLSAEGLTDTTLLVVGGTPGLPADSNGDGIVNDADYTIWADNYGATNAGISTGDYNGDGLVNDADYTRWSDNYGRSVGATPAPEPAAIAILTAGVLLTIGRRGRGR